MKTAEIFPDAARFRRSAEHSSFQRFSFQHFSFTQSLLFPRNPLFPTSGPATRSFNGLHPKSKFLAFIQIPGIDRRSRHLQFFSRLLNRDQKCQTKKFGTVIGLAGAMFGMAAKESQAALVASVTNDQGHKDLAAQLEGKGAAWVQFTRSNGSTGYASAVQLSPTELLVAAHELIDSSGNPITINYAGNSLNYNNPSSGQVAAVTSTLVNPNYNYANPNGTPDIGYITVGSPLNWNLSRNLLFGDSPPVGATLMAIGVGAFGDPSVGIRGQTGDMRAFVSRSISTPATFDSNIYGAMSGNRTSLGTYRGQAWGGDSGALVGYYDINNDFNFLGLVSQGSNASTTFIGTTYYTSFNSQMNWLGSIPELSTSLMFIFGVGLVAASRSRSQ